MVSAANAISALGWTVTGLEVALAVLLLIGYQLRLVAITAGLLLLWRSPIAMSISTGDQDGIRRVGLFGVRCGVSSCGGRRASHSSVGPEARPVHHGADFAAAFGPPPMWRSK